MTHSGCPFWRQRLYAAPGAARTRSIGLISPTAGVLATADAIRNPKHLIRRQFQANLIRNGGPLGECRIKLLILVCPALDEMSYLIAGRQALSACLDHEALRLKGLLLLEEAAALAAY